jgi:hypothetical protein
VIRCPGFAHLPFKGTKRCLIILSLFYFELAKLLNGPAVFDNRHRVEGDLSDCNSAMAHQQAGPPDSQCHDRKEFLMSKGNNQ